MPLSPNRQQVDTQRFFVISQAREPESDAVSKKQEYERKFSEHLLTISETVVTIALAVTMPLPVALSRRDDGDLIIVLSWKWPCCAF